MSAANRVIATLFSPIVTQQSQLLPRLTTRPSRHRRNPRENPEPECVRAEREAERLRRRRAKEEAKCLAELIGKKGETPHSIRAHIRIADDLERCLRRFIEQHPQDRPWVLEAIRFRGLVLSAFDELIRAQQYSERISAAEAEAAARAAATPPARPLLHELVVPVSA